MATQTTALRTANLKERPAPVLLDTGEELNPYRWIILIGLITAAILEVLDTTIVNVALPQMAGNLGATREEIGWVSTGYILSNVVVLPMTAWLASRFGRKRYLVGSILLFLVASFFCGTSRSLVELVFWRIIQGSGGAALLSTAQATLREIFPREQQGTVQSLYILGVIVAPTVGPTLGGWITDNYSWPWVFFVNLPIGLFSASVVAGFLSDSKHRVETFKIDWWGIGLLAVGLGSLQYVLEEGNSKDWFEDAWIVRFTVLSAVALISLIVWELHPKNRYPIVNLRVLKNRDLSAALLMFLALGFGLYGGVFIFPLFVQNILGFTPTVTGLVLMPGGIATGVSAIVCGRLLNGKTQLVKPQFLIITGMSLFIYSMWDLGHMTTMSGEPDTRLALIFRGAGLGMLFTPINLAAFNSLKGVEIAQGASMLNLMRQLGGSFGIALLGTYITKMTALHYSALATHIYAGNPALDQRMQMLTAGLTAKGYEMAAAKQAALAIIAGTVQKQALTMAYNDAFLLIGLSVVLVSPAVLLLRSRKKAAAGAEMTH
ncbi:MAG TPA: DHA2 family efflux MFS transporter permease subunit [Chthonomonadaceae bacterium]|nr:DHA2 family efflux MFS transporter permease subunit [Chthonomonadaceae bacterium]